MNVFPESLRELLESRFEQKGISTGDFVGASVMLREGNYVGQRFRWDAAMAIVFPEESQVKLYDADGQFVDRCRLRDLESPVPSVPQRRAA